MMRPDERDAWRQADSLLLELLELPTERRPDRLATLEVDPALRLQVEALLAAAESEGGPLDAPISWYPIAASRLEPPPRSLAGRRFGAYELDEEIGRGGMAVVYAAHRADGAFEQRVAVKVLGSGLLPTTAASRFRREQEVLARLRHPHVATLLDGGVADDGTPFLVMERIEGRTLDRYADEERLGVARRIDLLLQVADAVAYAHRNLVVHRDLKPGNVLVTAAGEAKLLDFGIAKLLESDGEAAERTEARSRLLTPGYAAPEQADGRPVTTATDVYGLGRILERLVRDVELDRDLAHIRSRALQPEPERRYADARAFAEDLARWRDGRPVHATPDSLAYRARKWAGRHRAGLAGAALVAAVAAAGLVATLVQAERARREAETAAAVSGFLVELFQASDPAESLGREVTVRELLDRGVEETRKVEGQPLFRARLLETLGGVYQSLGHHERAVEHWRQAIELRSGDGSKAAERQIASLRDDIGVALFDLDKLDEAGVELERALADRTRLDGPASAAVGETLDHLGVLAGHRDDFATAERRFREALSVRRPLATTEDGRADVAESLHGLGNALYTLGRFPECETTLREALEIHRAVRGAGHPDVAHDLNSLANLMTRSGRPAEAEPLMREALALRRQLYGEKHPLVAQNLNDLAVQLEHRGELAGAAEIYRQALASYEGLYGADHQATIIVRTNFGRLLISTGDFAEAEALFRKSLASLARSGGEGAAAGGRNETIARTGLGDALHGLGRLAEARIELERALAIARDAVQDVAFVAMVSLELGRLDLVQGRLESAEKRLTTAEAGYRERYGAEHIRTARAAMWLGTARLRRGQADAGAALLRAALATQTALLPPNHPHLVATRREVARLQSPAS